MDIGQVTRVIEVEPIEAPVREPEPAVSGGGSLIVPDAITPVQAPRSPGPSNCMRCRPGPRGLDRASRGWPGMAHATPPMGGLRRLARSRPVAGRSRVMRMAIDDVSPRRRSTQITTDPQDQSVSGRALCVAMSAQGRCLYVDVHSGVGRSDDSGQHSVHPERPQPPAGEIVVPGALLPPAVYDGVGLATGSIGMAAARPRVPALRLRPRGPAVETDTGARSASHVRFWLPAADEASHRTHIWSP